MSAAVQRRVGSLEDTLTNWPTHVLNPSTLASVSWQLSGGGVMVPGPKSSLRSQAVNYHPGGGVAGRGSGLLSRFDIRNF